MSSNATVAKAEQGGYKNLSPNGVNLSARVLLQGPYQDDTGLMNGDLHANNLLPITQPYNVAPFNYSGSEQLATEVLAATAQDTVVDWVLLELRDSTDSAVIVARQAVVLQRDGDLVDPETGAVALNFAEAPVGSYYISVRHRNHLDVLTEGVISLSTDVVLIDFSNPLTLVAGNYSRASADPFVLLWAGDGNQDGRLISNGVGNDANPLLSTVLLAEGNTGLSSNYQLSGYLIVDFNLDGKVIHSGPGNDANQLITNILLHPDNGGFLSNFVIQGGGQF